MPRARLWSFRAVGTLSTDRGPLSSGANLIPTAVVDRLRDHRHRRRPRPGDRLVLGALAHKRAGSTSSAASPWLGRWLWLSTSLLPEDEQHN